MEKIEIFVKKCSLSKWSRKKRWRKIYSMLTRGKKLKKIQTKLFHKHSKLCTLSKLAYTVLLEDIVSPSELFLGPNILWYSQNSKLVQTLIFPNGKIFLSNSFALINT